MYEDSLTHYGVLGMKWGIRKASSKTKSKGRTAKSKKKISLPLKKRKTVKKTKKTKQEDISSLSNDEIKKKIDRLLLEKQYKQLKNELTPASQRRGKEFVKGVVEASGKNIATQLTTYAMGTAVNKLAGQEIINPKKGQKDK